MKHQVKILLVVGALAAFAVPLLVFFAVGVAEGMGGSGAGAALIEQLDAPRQNLRATAIFGVLPVVLLAVVLGVHRWLRPASLARPALALGGLLPVLAILVWVNLEFWPSFLPSRVYPGFPHGLELVIGPLFFAPIAMAVGLLVGWLVYRSRSR